MEKKTEKIIKKFTSRMQADLLLVFCVITLLMVGLMGRLIYIVHVDGDRYTKQVLSQQTYISSVLPYKRGDILDCNGTVLAHSELQYRLILDPKLLLENKKCVAPTLEAINKSFGIAESAIEKILKDKPGSQYIIVQKNLKYDAVTSFKNTMSKSGSIVGVWFEEEYVRTYPYKKLACDLLGFASADNTGFYGIEEYYNRDLNGTNGREYGYYDENLDIEHIVKKAVNGNSIITTINTDIQRIIQEKIEKYRKEVGCKGIGIVVMNPNTGGIIAMASNQEFDLNSPRDLSVAYTKSEISAMTDQEKTDALNTIWKNDAISSNFEPGSTFKPITVASALDEGLVNEATTFVCKGVLTRGGGPIKCAHTHGKIDLGEAVMDSCNVAMMEIADKEGGDLFYQYEKSFGLGQKTGVDLPGEGTGQLIPQKDLKVGSSELATSSFGQSTTATMVQMAAAFSSVVNGGNYYQPHVMKKIVSDSGATVKDLDKLLVRKTISEATSELLQKYLYQTVEAGTATDAKVTGYTIGGKTGTAQKFVFDKETNKMARGDKKYIVSFIGCSPAINPEVVFYLIIDEPNVEHPSNKEATILSGQILKEILPVLRIFPEGKIDYLLPTPTPTPDPNAKKEDTSNQAGDENSTGNHTENNTGNENSTEGNKNNKAGNKAGSEGNKDNPQADVGTTGDIENNTEDNQTGDNAGDAQNSQENEDLFDPID
jgi:Cell division protein FtsI/penicillin-binding protein 2